MLPFQPSAHAFRGKKSIFPCNLFVLEKAGHACFHWLSDSINQSPISNISEKNVHFIIMCIFYFLHHCDRSIFEGKGFILAPYVREVSVCHVRGSSWQWELVTEASHSEWETETAPSDQPGLLLNTPQHSKGGTKHSKHEPVGAVSLLGHYI